MFALVSNECCFLLDVVRLAHVQIGPRELFIFDPAAIAPVLSSTKIEKGPFYGSIEPSLNATRDKKWYKQRRKIWDYAFKQCKEFGWEKFTLYVTFSDADMNLALTELGYYVEDSTGQLLERLEKNGSKPVLLYRLYADYSFDIMALLAFGRSTNFLTGTASDEADKIISDVQAGIYAFGLFLHVPWIMSILTTISSVAGPLKNWQDYSVEQVTLRKKVRGRFPSGLEILFVIADRSYR